jgi:hypothetical protein
MKAINTVQILWLTLWLTIWRPFAAFAEAARRDDRGAVSPEHAAWAAGLVIAAVAGYTIVRGAMEGWANAIPGGP